MTYATPSDITGRWVGENPPTSNEQLALLIGDAEVIINREFPDLADRLDMAVEEGGVASAEVKLVVVAMVTRLYRNPEGLRSRTDTSGPYTDAKTYAGINPGALALTDGERAILAGTSSSTGPRAFNIDPTPTAPRGWLGAPACVDPLVVNGPTPW